MKKLIYISLILMLLPNWALAYDPIFDRNNPDNMGTVPAIHDSGDGIPSTMTRWKSARIRATRDGTATHFIIRVGSNNVGSVPVGFAVYSGTSGERDPIGPLLIRGYYASFNFTQAGYYALPFTSATSINITSGNYYHLVYLLTPGDEGANSGWRVNNTTTPPPKWFSDCHGNECNANEPPGVGGEFWNGQYWPSSAGWAMGLLDGSGGVPPTIAANFSGSPTTGIGPLEVSFVDQSTGDISTWSWTFGDGNTSTVQDPVHTFDTPGSYSVELTVSGQAGSDTRTRNDYIEVTLDDPGPGPPGPVESDGGGCFIDSFYR